MVRMITCVCLYVAVFQPVRKLSEIKYNYPLTVRDVVTSRESTFSIDIRSSFTYNKTEVSSIDSSLE